MTLWLLFPIEFYKEHLAYKYWSPDLQAMAYRHMDFESWMFLCLFLGFFAVIFNFVFVLLWTCLFILKRNDFIPERWYRFGAMGFKVAIAFGCIAAMNFTNNLWVEIAN